MQIQKNSLYLIPKERIATGLFYAGMLIAFFGSMNVWFLLPIASFYPLFASVFIFGALVISQTMEKPIFVNNKFLVPALTFFLLNVYIIIVNDKNTNALIMGIVNTFILCSIFLYDTKRLSALSTLLAKILGSILLVSYPVFLLYLIGFPLPYVDMQFNDNFYSFSNYFFFLVDDRSLLAIIPRFQSIFLEPTYLGSTTAILLQTQRGQWKKWYNVSMLFGLLISFSLAGYAYLTAIIFLNLWINGKKLFTKIVITITLIAAFVGGSFVYNNGENLVHDLILLRLEIDDGELAGENRTSADFDAEYQTFLESDDILWGRDFDPSIFGNSGYQVYFFDYGLIGVLLLFIFYGSAFINGPNKRAVISAWIVCLLIWGVDGFVLWFGRFIPLYITAVGHTDTPVCLKEKT